VGIYHCSIKGGSKGNGASGTAKALYVCREGKYQNKPDLEGQAWHGNMPTWAKSEPRAFWIAADEHERTNARVFTEIEISLPRELTQPERRELVESFLNDTLGEGHPYTVAIHNPKALDGKNQPHAHIIFSERKHDGIERDAEQFFRRGNVKAPEKGGAAKDRAWNDRDKVQEVREAWERHYNKAVMWQELFVSCKSLKAQGIDREPEPKLGPKGVHSPAAERVKANRQKRLELQEINREIRRLSLEIEKAKADLVAAQVEEEKQERERQENERAETVITAPPRTLEEIEADIKRVWEKYEPTAEERKAHKAAYMKPATDRKNAYGQAVAAFNRKTQAWKDQGTANGWTYAPPLPRDAGFFDKTARAAADMLRSAEEKAWQSQGHLLDSRRDEIVAEKRDSERYEAQRKEDYRTRGTQDLFNATKRQVEATPEYQRLIAERTEIWNQQRKDREHGRKHDRDGGKSR